MRLFSGFHIKNIGPFRDTGKVGLGDFMTVVVGRNGVGKSALLRLLESPFTGDPFRSINEDPERSTVQQVCALFGENGVDELRDEPFPGGIWSATHLRQVGPITDSLQYQLTRSIAENGSIPWVYGRLPAVGGGNLDVPRPVADSEDRYLNPSDQSPIFFQHDRANWLNLTNASTDDLLRVKGAGHYFENKFRFSAERFGIGSGQITIERTLRSDGSNLASVLNLLSTSNPSMYERYLSVVRLVIPEIHYITVPPDGVTGTSVSIRAWEHEVNTERSDLARSLEQMGTGVGQVLSLLYVVLTESEPHLILIDEPQNFLHPGSVRALFEVFRIHGSQHQFVVTSHSAMVIDAAQPDVVLRLSRNHYETQIESFDSTDMAGMRQVLTELGSSLADVFGVERVLWVEGKTEELSYPLVIEELVGIPLGQTKIVGVLDTGSLSGKQVSDALLLYSRLSRGGGGVLPPLVGMLFDRETKKQKDIDDVIRLANQNGIDLRFLDNRMFEDYLLSPIAIKCLVDDLASEGAAVWDSPVTELTVEQIAGIVSDGRKRATDRLSEVFKASFGNQMEYRKVLHGPRLTSIVLEVEPERLRPVAQLLHAMLWPQVV